MSAFERIKSRDNELVKKAALLVSSVKYRRENRQFVLEGLRLCRDAVLNGFPVDILFVGDTAFEKFGDDAKFLSERAKRSCIVPDSIIEKISDTKNPQGFITVCSMKCDGHFDMKSDGKYIALENLADPSNLGAVSRTAEAFAFDGILVGAGGCDQYNPKALRASMGSLLRIPVYTVSNLPEFLGTCALKAYACVVDREAEKLNEIEFGQGGIAVIGNEANGLSEECISACERKITIPMKGKAESFNASTAAAIVMWEMSDK